jgi:glycosyltransferase involved in cell wall biosynthesis
MPPADLFRLNLKILVITSTYPPQHSGAGLLFSRLLPYFDDQRISVSVFNLTTRSLVGLHASPEGTNNIYLGTNPLLSLAFEILASLYIIIFSDADVVHCLTLMRSTPISAFVASLTGKAVIVEPTLAGELSFKRPSRFGQSLTKRLYVCLLRNQTKIFFKAYSSRILNEIRSAISPRAKIEVIPPPIELQSSHSTQNRFLKTVLTPETKLYCDLLNSDKHLVLFVGKKGYRKGYDIFCSVALRFHHSESQYLFISVGPDDCNDLALSAGNPHIFSIPESIYVQAWMNLCDTFLLPTREEGFGAVMYEALASNMNLVVGRLGGITEPLEAVGSSRIKVFPTSSPESFVDSATMAIRQFTKKDGSKTTNDYDNLLRHLGPGAVAAKHISLYHKALNKN